MGKPKMTALAMAIKAAEPLSDEEKQTLRDVLRPAPKPRSKSKPERKPSQKRKAGKGATGITARPCRDCDYDHDHNIHHKPTMLGYHEFVEPAGEASKGVGA